MGSQIAKENQKNERLTFLMLLSMGNIALVVVSSAYFHTPPFIMIEVEVHTF